MMENKTPEAEDSGDELSQLTQKALFVEQPTREINLETVPRDGSEFIHKSRLEDANLSFNQVECSTNKPEENEQKRMRQKARMSAVEFSSFALKLNSNRTLIKKRFPKILQFPRHGPGSEIKWCVLCLGSKLCSEIYGEKYENPEEDIKEHLPYLSIVAHFNPYTVYAVLEHLHNWFLSVGMRNSIGRWVYAVLACVQKPLHDKDRELITTFYDSCKKRLKHCDESERPRLYLISAILEYYFCVYSDKIGSTLETLLNLDDENE